MKNKRVTASLVFSSLVTLASAAHTQSITLSLIGRIVPTACVPTLTGGGVVDYGNVSASSLSTTTYTVLPEKQLAFNATCAAPMRIVLLVDDNRQGSVVPGSVGAIDPAFTDEYNFGLGTASGVDVGGYTIGMMPGGESIDGARTETLTSPDFGTSWATGGRALRHRSLLAWGASAAAGPQTGTVFTGTLTVQAVVNKASALPLTAAVPFDGSATLSLVYL